MNRSAFQVVFTTSQQAELLAVELDDKPLGPKEVTGRTVTSLVSAGTELAGYQGLWQGSKFPVNPGYAAVFQVDAVGSEVKDVQAGDFVFCMGRHQSQQRVQRQELLPLPQGLSADAAVFARLMGVTLTTLSTTVARPPAKVLVMGLGLVGHLAAKNFARCGYTVFAVDPVAARRTIALQAGVQNVLAATPLDDPTIAQQVALVLECSGHEQAFLDALNIVQKRGEVVQVATPWQRRTDLLAHDIQRAIFFNYPVVRSGWEWELPLHASDFHPDSIWGNLAAALQWLATDAVQVEGLYTKTSPRRTQEAYQSLLHNRAERLAIVFDWANLS